MLVTSLLDQFGGQFGSIHVGVEAAFHHLNCYAIVILIIQNSEVISSNERNHLDKNSQVCSLL